jgi:hypothetical protein
MALKLLIFDQSIEYIEEYRRQLLPNEDIAYEFALGDIETITREHDIDILVSDGDSCGLSFETNASVNLFPDIQARVQARIHSCCQTESQRGLRALPIGSALLVSTGDSIIRLMAYVPTMMLPCSIENTFNVYWAMRGLLKLLDTLNSNRELTIAMPCFGTDIGGLTPQTSAEQIAVAIDDHLRGNYSICDPECDVDIIPDAGKWAYILSGHAPAPPEID